jgi:hypothetical protein
VNSTADLALGGNLLFGATQMAGKVNRRVLSYLYTNFESFTERRALFHSVLHPPALFDYYPLIQDSSRMLLRMILEKPDAFTQHFRQ